MASFKHVVPYLFHEGPFTCDDSIAFYSCTKQNRKMLRDPHVLNKRMQEDLGWQYLDEESHETRKEHAQSAGSPVNLHPCLLGKFSLWSPMLQKGNTQDPVFSKVFKQRETNGYMLYNGILYHTINDQVRLCVPDTPDCHQHIKNRLLDRAHQTLGHARFAKTYQALVCNFF